MGGWRRRISRVRESALGIAGGGEGVEEEEVVVIEVVRQSRGVAFGACDGSGWRMGRRSGAWVVLELCNTGYQS